MSDDPELTVLRAPSQTGSGAPWMNGNGGGVNGESSAVLRPAEFGAPLDAMPQVLKQRFVLEEALGTGGMGTVYRARDLRKVEAQDRHPFVAIKLLNADFKQHPEAFIALEREASKSQSLAHPNIVSIYDFDKDGDVPFMVMELLEGQELTEILRQFPDGLPDAMAWPIIRGLLAGLRHAHEAGVTHADFKPGNVFVLPDQNARILDFGIARAVQLNVDDAVGEQTLFDPQRLAALTPAYASREMLNGDNAEPRDDLYSLGIVVYLILTGHHPYGRLSAKDAAAEQLKPDRPRRLSLRQWRALAQCLRFNRGDRPASVELVQRAFFEPPAWRSRTAGAAILGILLTAGVTALRDDVELAEVQQEARQTALQDVHVERLSTLSTEAPTQPGWFEQVADELVALQALPEAAAESAAMERRVQDALRSAMADAPLPQAIKLLQQSRQALPVGIAEGDIARRLEEAVVTVLRQPQPTGEWVDELDRQIRQARTVFPKLPRWAELELEIVDALLVSANKALAQGDLTLPAQVIADLEPRTFLYEPLQRLKDRLLVARQRVALRETERLTDQLRERYDAAVSQLLSDSCVSLRAETLAERLTQINRQIQGFSERGVLRLDARLAECVSTLAVSNPDLALTLRDASRARFTEDLPALAAVRLDPCAPGYLVGNGILPGRRGSCVDQLANGAVTGRLVVIPAIGDQPAFAIQQQEVSEAEYALFCQATASCALAPSDLPVRDIGVAAAERYARWLSSETGYTYRLPLAVEWQHAAFGDLNVPAAPSRNCLLKRGAMVRGASPVPVQDGQPSAFGLINAVGNLREWVRLATTASAGIEADLEAGLEAEAIGGSYADPLADCHPNNLVKVPGAGDPQTGFRLVRELAATAKSP